MTCFLALLGLEACARVTSTVSHDLREEDSWYVYSEVLGWDRRPGYSGRVYGPPRTFDRDGFLWVDTPKIHSDGAGRRVLFLGDSVTFGIGVPAEHTFVEVLDRALVDLHCINLAVPGYSSYQGYQSLVKYGERLNPSAIVAAFNINDRRYVLQPSEIDGPIRFRSLKEQSRVSVLEKSHLVRGLRRRARRFTSTGDSQPNRVDDVTRLYPRVSPEDYRENLSRIATWAKARAIPLLFVLFHDNPHSTLHLRNGMASLTVDQYSAAAEHLQIAVQIENMFSSVAQIQLSRLYELMERPADASITRVIHHSYHSVHGGTLLFDDIHYHGIMRDVSAHQGVTLLDTGSVLNEDPAVFFDFCHFNAYGHQRVAALLAPVLEAQLGK